MKNQTKAVVLLKSYNLAVPNQMVSMAKVLQAHVKKQGLSVNIVGKEYALVEAWQFAGGLMGFYPRVKEVINLSTDTEKKWQANVEIVRMKDDKIVGWGSAICSSAETKKRNFDEYAILSMAQTRAIGKAYRNLLGWVMKLAGMEATPAEEMVSVAPVKTEPKDKFEMAKAMIWALKTKAAAQEILVKLEASKLYTPEQKKVLMDILYQQLVILK